MGTKPMHCSMDLTHILATRLRSHRITKLLLENVPPWVDKGRLACLQVFLICMPHVLDRGSCESVSGRVEAAHTPTVLEPAEGAICNCGEPCIAAFKGVGSETPDPVKDTSVRMLAEHHGAWHCAVRMLVAPAGSLSSRVPCGLHGCAPAEGRCSLHVHAHTSASQS